MPSVISTLKDTSLMYSVSEYSKYAHSNFYFYKYFFDIQCLSTVSMRTIISTFINTSLMYSVSEYSKYGHCNFYFNKYFFDVQCVRVQ